MLYTISGARRETGQPITFNLEAPSIDHAAREANRIGIVVASVSPAAPDRETPTGPSPASTPPPPNLRPLATNQFDSKRTALNHGIDDFLMFRSMLTPWLVRVVFWVAMLIAVVFMFAWPFYVIRNNSPREHFNLILGGEASAAFGLIMFRILLELIIVVFRIHESIAELRLDLHTRR